MPSNYAVPGHQSRRAHPQKVNATYKIPPGTHGATAFLNSRAWFQIEQQSDHEWLSSYLLGAGGYGTVGCWRKRNAEGVVIDELAIKEQRRTTNVDPDMNPQVSEIGRAHV